jgi:hypothetical protein
MTMPRSLGIHSHADGLIHIHPFAARTSGANADLADFLDQVGIVVRPDEVELQDGTTLRVSDGCNGEPAELVVAVWPADAVATGSGAERVDSPKAARIVEDGMAFALAIVPTSTYGGTDLEQPPSVAGLDDPTAAENGGTPSWLVPPTTADAP